VSKHLRRSAVSQCHESAQQLNASRFTAADISAPLVRFPAPNTTSSTNDNLSAEHNQEHNQGYLQAVSEPSATCEYNMNQGQNIHPASPSLRCPQSTPPPLLSSLAPQPPPFAPPVPPHYAEARQARQVSESHNPRQQQSTDAPRRTGLTERL